MVEIGVALPTTEIGADPGAIREYVQAAEDLGYSHIRVIDHVLGADPQGHPEMEVFPYTHESVIHEAFTLLAYLAAITRRIKLVTSILILPQRQTALVAKQAAEVDVLSGGRLRLGIGVGWNPVEYEALGQDFHTRGRRSEEQIAVLRALWTQEVVSFEGRWHKITHAGLNPLPVQRPIPIWIGAGWTYGPVPPDYVLRRVAQLADGWLPVFPPDRAGREVIERMRGYARDAGRDPASIGIEGRITVEDKGPEDWLGEVEAWKEIGASHVGFASSGAGMSPGAAGLNSVQDHIDSMRRFKEAVGEG